MSRISNHSKKYDTSSEPLDPRGTFVVSLVPQHAVIVKKTQNVKKLIYTDVTYFSIRKALLSF
jgi:hypothetical protein